MWQQAKRESVLFKKTGKCQLWIHVFLISIMVAAAPSTFAQDEPEDADAKPAPAIYLPIKPAFVVNYGGEGKLRYLKTEISVRLQNNETADAVRHHLPFIRNNLVMLFAAQTDDDLQSQEGREMLRSKVLEQVKLVLDQENGDSEGVIDVFFSTFIVQK